MNRYFHEENAAYAALYEVRRLDEQIEELRVQRAEARIAAGKSLVTLHHAAKVRAVDLNKHLNIKRGSGTQVDQGRASTAAMDKHLQACLALADIKNLQE